MEEKDGSDATSWNTWEELLLCAAVLRHGHDDWKIVTAELLSRTPSSLDAFFTPEKCKAKYEELTRQYPLRKVWYDELRKKRIMELRQALEESDDSIGSLKFKLETLTTTKDGNSQETDDSSQCHAGKISSKDYLSAGSFTQDEKPEASVSPPRIDPLDAVLRGFSKGPRGARKRKHDVGENRGSCCSTSEIDSVISVFNSIARESCVSVFRRRLESQNRGRYKKMIVRHLDFEAIRSNISNGSIRSMKEVFRDLLLLANNALVFYSKNTREYKSALLLREIVTIRLTKHRKDEISKHDQEVRGTSLNVTGNVPFKDVCKGPSGEVPTPPNKIVYKKQK